MTQYTPPCPIAQWLTSVGYTGSAKGGMTALYPEDVAKLSKAVDAKVESACATMRAHVDKVTAQYESIIAMQERAIALRDQMLEGSKRTIVRLEAEIASLRDGGKIKPLEPPQGFMRDMEAVAKLRDQVRDAFFDPASSWLGPAGTFGKQNP